MTIFKGDNIVFKAAPRSEAGGFSLIELLISLVLSLLILGIGVAAFSSALGARERESSRTDALTSLQAALNVMSREIGNSGYGLNDNGIVAADSTNKQLHFRTNTDNIGANGTSTAQPGEDVTYYFDAGTDSIVRYDRVTGTTSGVINKISEVAFTYYNFTYDPATGNTNITTGAAGPNTAVVKIEMEVLLPDARMQPASAVEKIEADVTLRNSTYMLGQY